MSKDIQQSLMGSRTLNSKDDILVADDLNKVITIQFPQATGMATNETVICLICEVTEEQPGACWVMVEPSQYATAYGSFKFNLWYQVVVGQGHPRTVAYLRYLITKLNQDMMPTDKLHSDKPSICIDGIHAKLDSDSDMHKISFDSYVPGDVDIYKVVAPKGFNKSQTRYYALTKQDDGEKTVRDCTDFMNAYKKCKSLELGDLCVSLSARKGV